MKEIGPFTYQEETERVEEVFHDNGTVSYKTQKHWYFLREESVSLDTIISTLDVPVRPQLSLHEETGSTSCLWLVCSSLEIRSLPTELRENFSLKVIPILF